MDEISDKVVDGDVRRASAERAAALGARLAERMLAGGAGALVAGEGPAAATAAGGGAGRARARRAAAPSRCRFTDGAS